MDNSTSLNKAF